ncbi:hypothetical protein PS723_06091 [Pseudomonas fluorescens]|uniref:Uncharacterized protein n=1 Tax=Pseudomonas fluorescens TaxID=294 RepID=A0A5E7FW58_PSEFL|nr:hypothetical protein PS723_06091 [Pseudomonas fluorescens]
MVRGSLVFVMRTLYATVGTNVQLDVYNLHTRKGHDLLPESLDGLNYQRSNLQAQPKNRDSTPGLKLPKPLRGVNLIADAGFSQAGSGGVSCV